MPTSGVACAALVQFIPVIATSQSATFLDYLMMTQKKTLLGVIFVIVATVALSAAVCPVLHPHFPFSEKTGIALPVPDAPQPPPMDGTPDDRRLSPATSGGPHDAPLPPLTGNAPHNQRLSPLSGDAPHDLRLSPPTGDGLSGRRLLSSSENDPFGLRWLTPIAPQGSGRLPGWPQRALVTEAFVSSRQHIAMSPVIQAPLPIAASHYALDQRDDECRRAGGGNELRHSRPESFFFSALTHDQAAA